MVRGLCLVRDLAVADEQVDIRGLKFRDRQCFRTRSEFEIRRVLSIGYDPSLDRSFEDVVPNAPQRSGFIRRVSGEDTSLGEAGEVVLPALLPLVAPEIVAAYGRRKAGAETYDPDSATFSAVPTHAPRRFGNQS